MTSRACGHPDCCTSSGICEELTFGRGKLDDHGYWQFSCRPCAAAFEAANPDAARKYGVWPGPESDVSR